MKKENLTASHLTYRILIATRGETRDLIGMEQLLEDMKSHGLQPDAHFVTDLISNVNDIVKDGDMHHLLNRKIFLLCYIHLHWSNVITIRATSMLSFSKYMVEHESFNALTKSFSMCLVLCSANLFACNYREKPKLYEEASAQTCLACVFYDLTPYQTCCQRHSSVQN